MVLRALQHQAAAVVLAHNHPSGSVQPSRADEAPDPDLKAALALVDVRVLDHVIVAPGAALSMAEQGPGVSLALGLHRLLALAGCAPAAGAAGARAAAGAASAPDRRG